MSIGKAGDDEGMETGIFLAVLLNGKEIQKYQTWLEDVEKVQSELGLACESEVVSCPGELGCGRRAKSLEGTSDRFGLRT